MKPEMLPCHIYMFTILSRILYQIIFPFIYPSCYCTSFQKGWILNQHRIAVFKPTYFGIVIMSLLRHLRFKNSGQPHRDLLSSQPLFLTDGQHLGTSRKGYLSKKMRPEIWESTVKCQHPKGAGNPKEKIRLPTLQVWKDRDYLVQGWWGGTLVTALMGEDSRRGRK